MLGMMAAFASFSAKKKKFVVEVHCAASGRASKRFLLTRLCVCTRHPGSEVPDVSIELRVNRK